jgi:hypothetical protein
MVISVFPFLHAVANLLPQADDIRLVKPVWKPVCAVAMQFVPERPALSHHTIQRNSHTNNSRIKRMEYLKENLN